jgi:tetratricopeptide (TPR) repeat protein
MIRISLAIIALFAVTATFGPIMGPSIGHAGETDVLAEARTMFDAGDYLPAAEKARNEGSAEGLALATQITCYYGRYLAPEEARMALFEGAMETAAKALELDPDSAFVRVQNAHALGRYSQQLGIVEALAEGMAGKVREQIDAALALDPENAAAHLLLANWHAAIINNSGFIGRMVYGAEEEEVFAHYAEAIRIAPADVQIRVEYARAMLELDAEEHAAAAREQLDTALALPAETDFFRVLHGEARNLLKDIAAE